MRTTLATAAGTLMTMPAAGDAGVGVKLVTLSEFNPQKGLPFVQATYVLFDVESQRPEAVIDGTELTAIRTAAVSGVATDLLARQDASRLVLFGAGVQATAHLEAMCVVRPVDEVVVVSRGTDRADALVARAASLGLSARVGMPEDVSTADLVCTCTTSAVSVFQGEDLAAGAHVNAIGASLPHQRELDTEAIRRAKVVVETRREALAEAGDLLIPIGEGAIDASHIRADLTDLARGAVVRTDPSDITVFKSVGMAYEDLVVARAALDALG
jgi:ornithine cyclodeaminase